MPRLFQEILRSLVEYKNLKGIDNLCTDDMRLPTGFVRVAKNVDFDSEMMAHRRKGILQALFTGEAHSLWSDEDKLCFVVFNNNLIQINLDWTTNLILSGVGLSKMNFVKVGDRVFFSNLEMIGYIEDGVPHGFPEVTRPMRQRMVGGEIIEYYNARLYATQGECIYFSVAASPMEMEEKRNFMVVGGPITMLHSVVDGFYLSAGDKVSFNRGDDPFELKYKILLDVPAIKGSPTIIERLDLGKGAPLTHKGVLGRCVIFHTSIGAFLGLPGGHLQDLSSDHYAITDMVQGCGLVKWHNGYRQYIFVGEAPNI